MGGAILQTRRFRSGPIDIEILRTAILLSAHQTRHHVGAADPLPVGVPVNVGVANAEGAAVNFARRDHVHNHPAALGFALHHTHYAKYLWTYYTGIIPAELACESDVRVYLVPIAIPFTVTVDAVGYMVKTIGVPPGNARVGIYADGVASDIPDGGALLVQSASVAKVNLDDTRNEVSIADTQLSPSLVWAALISDEINTVILSDWTGSYGQNLTNLVRTRSYDLGAYGALTDPCPATVSRRNPILYLRVKSIP